MKLPTIYIITPCRNAVSTINDTINSIITQRGSFFIRYHIQDCCSTDGTLEILQEWQELIQNNTIKISCLGIEFSYLSELDSGLYDGIVKGFEYLNIVDNDAFMTWINADDVLINGTLSTIVEIQQTLPNVNWVTGNPCQFNENSLVYINVPFQYPTYLIQKGYMESRFLGYFIQQEGTFWRKRLWDKSEKIDPRLKFAGDFDLWTKFAKEDILWVFNGPLGIFRIREGQLSSNIDNYFKEIDLIMHFDTRKEMWGNSLQEIYSNPNDIFCSAAQIFYDYNDKKYKTNITEFQIKNYITVTNSEGVLESETIEIKKKHKISRGFRKIIKFLMPYGLITLYQNRRN